MSGGLGISQRLTLGRKQSAAWAAAVLLTGSAFSATQIAPGLVGSYDTVRNASRIYLATQTATDSGGCLWCGWIKGTGATLVAPSSASAGGLVVSIDGGAYANAADSSFTYTLFTGLEDVEHYVVIKTGASSDIYLNKAGGNILNITGASPYVVLPRDWVYPGVADALGVAAGMTKANVANHTPARTKRGIYSTVSNISAARIRGNFQRLVVASNGASGFTDIWLSIDGAAPTKHTLSITPGIGGYAHQITGLSGLHTYTAWTNLTGCVFSIAGDGAHVDIGSKRQIHQFGDSTSTGSTGNHQGEVEIFRIGASCGYAALTAAINGQTVEGLDAALDTYLAALTVTAADVAVLAVGRNNLGGSWLASTDTALASCITKLINKGYGKIICRGVLPTGTRSSLYPTESGKIQTAVTAAADAKVVFCDISGTPAHDTVDGVHPNAAGYATIAAHLEPLYRTILGLA